MIFRSSLFCLIGVLLASSTLVGFDEAERLMEDLIVVDYWNKKKAERFPVTYNQLLQGGYLVMPSARMGCEGELGIGYSWIPPYRLYNLRAQILPRLELSGNYRLFTGVPDPILAKYGFGDLADRGASIKWALFLPEESEYRLPGVVIGTEDFIGTKGFHSRYVALTQVFPERGFEVTLGWGWQRYHGFFGGFAWFPFLNSPSCYWQPLSIAVEYDATRYGEPEVEKHPKARKVNSRINLGLKYSWKNVFDCTLSFLRGRELGFSASLHYNLGYSKGLLPKIHDAKLYRAPRNHQPISALRPEHVLLQDIAYALLDQGFFLIEGRLKEGEPSDTALWLRVENRKWRQEWIVRDRFTHILAALIPSDIAETVVVLETEGFPVQEYHFHTIYLRDFLFHETGAYEMAVINPLCDFEPKYWKNTRRLYHQPRRRWNLEIYPKTHTFFGSAKGKFKYGIGLNAGINGFLGPDLYYSVVLGWVPLSDLDQLSATDRLNPSQRIQVRTDSVRYLDQKGVTLDEAYLQKVGNLGRGWYWKMAGGYFEQAYGGLAGQILYFPLYSPLAIGLEGAFVGKRTYSGIGFTNTIRRLHGFSPSYESFVGSQYFCTLVLKSYVYDIDAKIKAGKFLGNDYGARFELSRYFPSGLRLYFWYTWTNGNDKINGQTYHDKGIGLSMPLDILYTYSSRQRWHYTMAAWLRDVGAVAFTGRDLYELINEERQ